MSNLSEGDGQLGSTEGLVLKHTDPTGIRARHSAKDRQEEEEGMEGDRRSSEALSQEDMRPLAEQLVEWAGKNPIPAAVASLMLVLLFLLTQTF